MERATEKNENLKEIDLRSLVCFVALSFRLVSLPKLIL